MKKINFLLFLMLVPCLAFGAVRGDSNTRIGINRISQAGARIPVITTAATVHTAQSVAVPTTTQKTMTNVSKTSDSDNNNSQSSKETVVNSEVTEVIENIEPDTGNCRDAYRECMDEFCLLDESQGERCACSNNIIFPSTEFSSL